MIYSRRIKSLIYCIAAFAAYSISLATLAGGAVLCQEPAGGASIEFVCDHDHCEVTVTPKHDHDICPEEEGCQGASCPCEDSPIILDMVRAPARFHLVYSSGTPPILITCSQLSMLLRPCVIDPTLPYHPPPWLDQTHQQRQTVVLIV